MERHQTDAPEQAAWHSPRGRPTRPQWHLLGVAVGRTMARSAGNLRTSYDLLQSVRPLAAGWRLGPDHGGVDRRAQQGAWANIPPKVNRKDPICFSPHLYRARNLVERFFNKIKQCRRIATHYDKLAANYLAFIKLASIRLWLRTYESTP